MGWTHGLASQNDAMAIEARDTLFQATDSLNLGGIM